MLFIEVSRKETKNGNILQTIKDGWYNVWDEKRIKGAFNFGNGTLENFKNYAKNNKPYCYIINVADGNILCSNRNIDSLAIYKARQIWENI